MLAMALLLIGSAAAQSGKTSQENLGINIEVNESGNYSLDLGQEANITSISVSGSVSQNGSARIYMESEEGKKLIFDSKRPLFDVNVMVLPEYKSVPPGSEIVIEVSAFNLRGFGRIDAWIEYSIRHKQGRTLGSKTENAAIETKAKFIRNLAVSDDIQPGTYLAFVSVNVGNSSLGSSSDSFEIKEMEKKLEKQEDFILNTSLVAMILILVSIITFYWFSKKGKEDSHAQIKQKTESIRKKLKSLEKAHNMGSISKETYEKSKKALEQEIMELENKP